MILFTNNYDLFNINFKKRGAIMCENKRIEYGFKWYGLVLFMIFFMLKIFCLISIGWVYGVLLLLVIKPYKRIYHLG